MRNFSVEFLCLEIVVKKRNRLLEIRCMARIVREHFVQEKTWLILSPLAIAIIVNLLTQMFQGHANVETSHCSPNEVEHLRE